MTGRLRLPLMWLGLITLVCLVAHLTGFEFKDGDSRLYARQAAALAQQPLSSWLSPQWPPHYYKEGLFEEHLAVFFWPMALLGKAGVPEQAAALFVNLVYLALLLLALYRIGHALGGDVTGQLASWCGVVSVGGFIYALRANHETAVAMGVAWAVVALMPAQPTWKHRVLLLGSVVWCVAMKGLVGLVVLPALGMLSLVRGQLRTALPSLVLATGAAGLFLWLHDLAFAAANGHSFVEAYLNIHTGYAEQREQASAFRKFKNVAYYAGAWLWWFFPWTLWLLKDTAAAVRTWRSRAPLDDVKRFVLGLGAATVVFIVFFSAFDRRASRYIFGIQPLVAAAVAPALPSRVTTWFTQNQARTQWMLLGVFGALVAVRLVAHALFHTFYSFNLANPD